MMTKNTAKLNLNDEKENAVRQHCGSAKTFANQVMHGAIHGLSASMTCDAFKLLFIFAG